MLLTLVRINEENQTRVCNATIMYLRIAESMPGKRCEMFCNHDKHDLSPYKITTTIEKRGTCIVHELETLPALTLTPSNQQSRT